MNCSFIFVLWKFGYYMLLSGMLLLAGLGATVHTCGRNKAQLNECLHECKTKEFWVTSSLYNAVSRVQQEELISIVSSLFNGKLNILISYKTSISLLLSYFAWHFTTCSKFYKSKGSSYLPAPSCRDVHCSRLTVMIWA
jgi:hypothetical protein